MHADDSTMAGWHSGLGFLSMRVASRVAGPSFTSSSCFCGSAVIHSVCRLVIQVYIVSIVHLELLAIHGLLCMRELKLGRGLEAGRSHFFSQRCLREVCVRRKCTVQTVSQRATFVQVLISRNLPWCFVQVFFNASYWALAKGSSVSSSATSVSNLAYDSLSWQIVRATTLI